MTTDTSTDARRLAADPTRPTRRHRHPTTAPTRRRRQRTPLPGRRLPLALRESALVGANVCIVPPKHHWFGIAHNGFAAKFWSRSTTYAAVIDARSAGRRRRCRRFASLG